MKKINVQTITAAGITAVLAISLLIINCSGGTSSNAGGIEKFTLDNGMQVILKENHASPMITSLVFVTAGSKYETKYNNGVTHFLEHLLFNGTAGRTQQEISEGIERLGGYINAFTRKEFTAYLVLTPAEFIDYGIATQADMLFNSVFPEETFPKERKIVTEEIKMGDDAEGAPAESFFEEKAYARTPYARPIIGYESIIANIPREAVIDYYKRFYAPNNMIALIIGDFDSGAMKKTIESIFGRFPSVNLPASPEIVYQPLEGCQVFKTPAETRSAYINFSIEAPHYSGADYFAFTLLADYLDDSENSPLVKTLKSGATPLVTSVSTYLDTKKEFSRLNIEIISEKSDRIDTIIALADSVLKLVSANPPTEELLNGYKVTRRCDEIYLSEKLHHYGFVKAPLMAITGWDFFEKLQTKIDSVTTGDITRAARNYLDSPACIVAAIYPRGPADGKPYRAQEPDESQVLAYYDEQAFPEYDLTAGEDFRMPDTDREITTASKNAEYLKETLPNGATVIIKSNPDSRVFALNVIGRNRAATEPEGKDGITDFVNRMIEKGTADYPGDELALKLAAIGAKATLYDNPWIPFDDRYTTPQFSFMKFETIDEFTSEGIGLFCDMIANPAFDSVEVEKIRSEIFGLLGRNSGSTYKNARYQFYSTLFKGTPYSRKINGNYRTVNSITRDDLIEHYRKIYAPENMIITVGTNRDPAQVMALLKEELQKIPATGFEPVATTHLEKIKGVKKAHERMEKEQVYIYLGNLLSGISPTDAPSVKVAAEILSSRLRDNLREKQGLAYSVGASAVRDKDFGWYTCSIGTSAENYRQAVDGILSEIERLKTEPPTDDELEMAVNSLWGSYLTANLSRINQAFYMGVYEHLGFGYDYGREYISGLRKVTAASITEAAAEYFDTDNYVLATAGNI